MDSFISKHIIIEYATIVTFFCYLDQKGISENQARDDTE